MTSKKLLPVAEQTLPKRGDEPFDWVTFALYKIPGACFVSSIHAGAFNARRESITKRDVPVRPEVGQS